MKQKKQGSNLIVQASILAFAGLITKVIGLLYRGPLTDIIGDLGNGAYGTAYTIYAMILLISSYSIPMAVSKVMSARLALKEYKNAHRIFICSLIYVCIVGGIASILTFTLAPSLNLLGKPDAVPALQILAPTILFSGILGVFRGYFQAQNTMVPTSISQILEQILNAVGSVFAAYLFTRPFVMAADIDGITKYGAAGGALGTGIGVVTGLLFCIVIYFVQRKSMVSRIQSDTSGSILPYKNVLKLIILMVTPVIFSTFVYNISTSLDMVFFYGILQDKGVSDATAQSMYGIFTGKYDVLIKVPVALASAMAATLIPVVSGYFARGERNATNRKISQSIHFTMLLSIPAAVGMAVLANPIVNLIFKHSNTAVVSNNDLAANLIFIGSISIVFYALSTISNGVLQGIGQMKTPVYNALIALGVHTVFLVVLLKFTNLDLYALVLSAVLYSFLMCILNGRSMKKYLDYKMDYKKLFVIPTIASAVMGVVAYGSYHLLFWFLPSNLICLIVSVSLSMVTYFVCLLKFKGITEKELLSFPRGNLFIRIAKKLHIMDR